VQFQTLGRYTVRGELGRGSMGIVYSGHDPVIDRPIALKTVLFPDALTPEERSVFLERFFMEARTAGKIVHPNIVVIHDAATDETTGTPFIAMELIEGEPLSRRLSRQGALAWRDAVAIGAALADALDQAHRLGVVHRDIKPANIVLTTEGLPKITDFGIAKLPTGKLTQTGVVIGTPYFMSPEQLRGDALDGRSDLFSLGAMLYNLVSGAPPFEGSDLASIAGQVLYKHPRPLSESLPDVPVDLDRVVARAMAKDVDERYQTGAQMAADLRAVLQREPLTHASTPGSVGIGTVTAVHGTIASPPPAPAAVTRKTPAATTSRAPRWLLVGIALLVLCGGLAFVFRENIGQGILYSEARKAFEDGALEKSESRLEALLARNPEFDGASPLLGRVSAALVRPDLPIELVVRHRHRLGSCTGTLVLDESRIEYRSTKHPLWRWEFDHLRALDRAAGGIHLETNDADMMGLLETKNYNFDIVSGTLPDLTWKRYQRSAAAAR
jgi:eukaryotic-like serine/threonine-protein kinase